MDLLHRSQPFAQALGQYVELTKPRIVMLTAFCAMIGMALATDALVPWRVLVFGTLGISLLAGAGFAFNCLLERGIDARMARTRGRPAASGEVSLTGAGLFASLLGLSGAALLLAFANPLTLWLTLATFVGYALIYTLILGASGAMPPLLGWAAVANEVGPQALVLFLIIFVWTPPHFWALALYRIEDYKRSGLPMLPVTHGAQFTRLHILLYTVMLVATTVLPWLIGMSGLFYLVCALALGAVFVWYAWRLWRHYTDALARRTFTYSIQYLAALFAALLVDHWL
jgi:protoheme IX farnesyltransferase